MNVSGTRTSLSKLKSTALVLVVPILALVAASQLTGAATGNPELFVLAIVWLAGLGWVWRPRRHLPRGL